MEGKLLECGEINLKNGLIDFSKLAKGSYIFVISSRNQTIDKKIKILGKENACVWWFKRNSYLALLTLMMQSLVVEVLSQKWSNLV